MLLARALVQEIADDFRDFGVVRLQREVAGVEEALLKLLELTCDARCPRAQVND